MLLDPDVAALVGHYGRAPVVAAIRAAADTLRDQALRGGSLPAEEELTGSLREDVARRVREGARRTLRRAINATGIVLHTGLGRAVLASAAADAMAEAAGSHSILEVDPDSGDRGSRLSHVAPLLRELTGAEDGLAVNNNAAAVFLGVAALAQGREVLISRGQLVEIGGSFRIPDVIRAAGARLVEVGTTNRVRISDYAGVITPETALLLRVHPSNFRIVGFTEEPPLGELVALSRERGIPVMDDLGSGALVDLTRRGLTSEPTVRASVEAGANVVTFSGDKLLGGPQAGLVVGGAAQLEQMRKHPLMRVVRLDKVTLAGLEATLRLYRDEGQAMLSIPTLIALTRPPDTLRAEAGRLAAALGAIGLAVELEAGTSQVGGGSLPGEELPTTLVAVQGGSLSPADLARRLRTGSPSVWGRVQRDRLLFDVRTVRSEEVDEIAEAVRQAIARDR